MDYRERFQEVHEDMNRLGAEIPKPMQAFARLHEAAVAEGALDTKMKELIALAIGITVRCDGCIAFHVHQALEAGANRQEVMETIAVAIMMGGGPSVVYGSEAMEALDQLSAAPV